MVDARLANPRLVPGKAMACVVGLSRMDIVIVTFADLYTNKTSGPETSFELLKARQKTPLRGVSRNARLSEEKANHWERSDRLLAATEPALREESQEVAELLYAKGVLWGNCWR